MKGSYSKSKGSNASQIKVGDRGGFGPTVKAKEFKDRNAAKDTSDERFAPTDGDAVKLHHKLAGG